MIDVETELNKHRSCRDRDELEGYIKEYKNLALMHANNFVLAGQYNTIAQKLQEICNKLPAPHLKHISSGTQNAPVKTVNITNEEEAKIEAAWKQRAGSKNNGVKR